MSLSQLNSWKCVGGFVRKFLHKSTATKTDMKFSVFLPPQAMNEGAKVPALYWLSGLTCTDDNFIQKAAVYKAAAHHGIAIIAPDTSPRGAGVAGESDSWDFGAGAGFYVNATTPAFATNYRMFDYVTSELPSLIAENFPSIGARKSISGHSMGGLGALNVFLKSAPGNYRSVSAFAPISNPSNPLCAWGQKAFSGYFGSDSKEEWKNWDPTELVRQINNKSVGERKEWENLRNGSNDNKIPILIDQGGADEFLHKSQLLPESLISSANEGNLFSIDYRLQDGYDHSYFFIQTFIDDHINFHAKYLKQ